MGRVLALIYGVACYLVFFLVFLWSMVFVTNLDVSHIGLGGLPFGAQILAVVSKTIDSGVPGPLVPSLLIDAALLGLFAVQHSVMARPAFKAVWTRIVPPPVERSTYVLLSSLILALVNSQWRPIGGTVWSVGQPLAGLVTALAFVGFGITLIATFLLSHFALFGLSQSAGYAAGKAEEEPTFQTPFFYKVVRHPIYFGFLVAFWSAPTMTVGHLVFSLGATGYIVVGTLLEERDLVAQFGDAYRDYRRRVSMFIPWFPKKAEASAEDPVKRRAG